MLALVTGMDGGGTRAIDGYASPLVREAVFLTTAQCASHPHMPQLDRVLPRLDGGGASEVVLEADAPLRCRTASGLQPLSQQVLTRQQVLALVAEVASPAERAVVAGGIGIALDYALNGHTYTFRQEAETPAVRIVVRRSELPVTPNAALPDAPRVFRRRTTDERPLGPFTSAEAAREAMERLLRRQVERGAADLHLRIGEPPILRTGGDLVRVDDEAALDEQTLNAMLWSIMPDKNATEFTQQWDTDFAHEITGVSRFRVNVFKDRNGVASVTRTIASKTVTVEEMGVTTEVQQLCNLTKGLVLVTGPTGSGKSTTLCALIDLVNRSRQDHIITIEDPIEFVHTSKKCLITQRQVGVHTQSFKSALRAALREDPDIIMVGELRDLETIAIALETAETGHLVFGTLHTSTAASTINRIVDQFPADRQDQIKVMLAESLKGVVSQTLCRKIGGGRVAAREILLVNKAVSSMIREGKTVQINNIIQTQKKLGMETLNDALLTLVKSGQVEPVEAYNKSVEKKDMALKLRALGHDMSAYVSDE